MFEICWGGERLILLPQRAVFWPRLGCLIVADLHLGKPAAFRHAGLAVPELATAADLQRLDFIIRQTGSCHLIVLGDLFHTRSGQQPEMLDAVATWRAQMPELAVTLIPGNHDRKSGRAPENWRVSQVDDCWLYPPFTFCHEPRALPGTYVVAGHIHPAVVLRERFGARCRAAAFCFGKQRAILPAFGSFTGMAGVRPGPGDRLFAVSPDGLEIVEISVQKEKDPGIVKPGRLD